MIIALAADDGLFELLVFKGGNPLAFAHGVGVRTFLDLDDSLAHETPNDAALGARLLADPSTHLSKREPTMFDWKFGPRPKKPKDERAFTWGGDQGEKLIETTRWKSLACNRELPRKQAWGITASSGASRKFTIELSKSECTAGAGEVEVGGFTVRVYTPSMIAVDEPTPVPQSSNQAEV